MSKKELKSLELVRKSLKKEIERVDKFEEMVSDAKKQHPIAAGYLEGLRERRHAAHEELRRVETAIDDLESGVAQQAGKRAPEKRASKGSSSIAH
jgi:chromosome segregation ATPase